MFSAATKTAAAAGGYQISRSLRFNSADGTSLDRTPSSSTNRQTFTLSFWAKNPSTAGAITTFYAAGSDTNNNETLIGYWDGLFVQNALSGATWRIRTTAVYRDPSAWYHFIFAFDLSNGTQANRLKIYVNGVEAAYSAADGNPLPSTANSMVNSNVIQYIGRRAYSATGQSTNAYLTEFYLIDGQALTPSSFGETNAQTGVWQPKAYAGSYGTNGFYLNFSDNSNTTAATLGKDSSPNGNNWTPNNFSVAAGAGNDSLVDSPTAYGTDTGAGGEVRGNYCTFNPLKIDTNLSLANGNLDLTRANSSGWKNAEATTGVQSGKWYFEITPTGANLPANFMLGVGDPSQIAVDAYLGGTSRVWGYQGNGNYYNNGSTFGSKPTIAANDVVMVAYDLDNGRLWFGKNGSWNGGGSPAAGTSPDFTNLTGIISAAAGWFAAGTASINFGQRPFAYTAPSGFRALCTQNLPTPTIGATTATQAGKYFNPVLWTGTGATQNITGVGFDPDFIWMKDRNTANRNHYLFDRLRGITNARLFSNLTDAENTSTTYINSTNSDGYQLSSGDAGSNGSGETYVGWNWKANGSGVTNTAGSITSTVSANTTAGFSIVTYTGTGSNATIGHGLGVAPRMIIVKRRNGADIWPVYHESIGNTQYLRLQGENPAGTFNVWQNTSPTSSVFYISTDSTVNTNTGTYVAYCFAEVPGYSRFGSYTGNGSTDGPFVFTGFRPAYVMIKSTGNPGGQGNWVVKDKLRAAQYNPQDGNLYPNLNLAEDTTSTVYIDLLSNGFKIRGAYNGVNASGETYIFAAFAEAPFKYALAR